MPTTTHVETWLGSGWGGQLLDMWRGKVAIGGRLGRRAGGRKWPGEWRGPSSKGVIDVYALCNLTSPLHYFDDVNKPMASWPFPLLLSEQPLKSRHFRFLVRRAMAVYLFITILEKKWKHNKRFFVRNESCLSLSAGCLVCLGGTPDICHTSAAHHSIQPIFHLKQSAKYKYWHTNTNTYTNIRI